ncbi:TPA: GNAT family N-acetyltransferase [Photobacterium damselae]
MTQHFTLETERLYLRPFKDVDLFPFLQALYDSMAELSPWLEWCDYNFTQDDAKEWIANSSVAWQTNTGYEFAVFDKRSDELLGAVALTCLQPLFNSANLGYWIHSSYHHQGIAKEACQAIIHFGFEDLSLTRLEIVTHMDNIPSQQTALACGAQFEAISRNRVLVNDIPNPGYVYSIIPQDVK